MGAESKIEWTDATWNIARGCTKVDEDCKYCYMYRDSLDSTRYDPKRVVRTKTVFDLPLKLKKPSRIFTSSLTDVFHEDLDAYREEMWSIIRKCPHHTFQILTKRPERIANHLPGDWGKRGYDNVWLGTSIGSNASMERLLDLVTIPARIRFLSLEPIHGEINLDDYLWLEDDDSGAVVGQSINWVIIGGESGNNHGKYRYRPCNIEWIKQIINDAQRFNSERITAAPIKIFVKQLGTHLAKQYHLKDRHGAWMEEWPTEIQRLREFPE